MLLGVIGAVLASAAYGFASVLQAIGVRHRPGVYAVGLGLDALGFLASLAALHSLPLFVVESVIAASVAVTAVAAVPILGARLGRAEAGSLGLVGVGLVALAVSAQPGVAERVGHRLTLVLLIGLVPVLVLGVVGLAGAGPRGGLLLAVVAGLGFAGTGVAGRELAAPEPWWHLIGEPLVWALAGYGVVSLVAFGYALSRAPVTAVAAITYVVETVVPAAVGVVWLGDRVRGHLWPLAVLGVAATVVGCVLLARFTEPKPIEDGS